MIVLAIIGGSVLTVLKRLNMCWQSFMVLSRLYLSLLGGISQKITLVSLYVMNLRVKSLTILRL